MKTILCMFYISFSLKSGIFRRGGRVLYPEEYMGEGEDFFLKQKTSEPW